MKVYCENCEHLLLLCRTTCNHPDNIKDTYLRAGGGYIATAPEKNVCNDCPDFIANKNQ